MAAYPIVNCAVWHGHGHRISDGLDDAHGACGNHPFGRLGVVVADWVFTTPAGVLQPLSGFWLIHLQGYSLAEPWLLATYALYLLAFCCWDPVVLLQLRIRDWAGEALAKGTPLPDAASRAYRMWFMLGWPAFTALVAVFWLMVNKPQF